MITLITVLIFTAAVAGAAEYAWWSPERRTRQEIEHRLRGLRVEAGRRPDSLLRQQYSSSGTFLSKLEIMKRLQDSIDQARLPYRAGNVVLFSVVLLSGGAWAADGLPLFPCVVL